MEHLTASQLQKLLEDEATTLHLMQSKISNQIHLLQVEEEFFRQELEKLQREGLTKDYPNQEGVNQIVEVTNEDVAKEGDDLLQIKDRDRAHGVKNIVEIATEDVPPGFTEAQEVAQNKGAEGVNQIVEVTGDEDQIMRESNSEGYGQASTSSHPWLDQAQASNLEYEILEPSSDDSETELEDSNTGKKRMLAITYPSDVSGTVIGEKRQRGESSETESELNSEMEVEEDSDEQRTPAISPARSPPRKKQTPRRKAVGS